MHFCIPLNIHSSYRCMFITCIVIDVHDWCLIFLLLLCGLAHCSDVVCLLPTTHDHSTLILMVVLMCGCGTVHEQVGNVINLA